MASIDLSSALDRQAQPQKRTVLDLIARQAPAIERVLAGVMDTDRFTRIVTTELQRNPSLYECSPESLLGGVMLSAQLGLEFGPLGHAYLVPYKRQATFMLGYKGMIALARRSGQLADIVARTVYQGDTFEYQYGTGEKLRHIPCRPSDRGEVACYYGLARLRPSGTVIHVMYPEDIEAARARSMSARRETGPWTTDYDAMARKTVIRRMSPFLPMDAGFARAIEADEAVITAPTELNETTLTISHEEEDAA